MLASRDEVYAALDGERNYQDQKWNPERNHSVTEWLVFIEDYAAEAKHVLSRQKDELALAPALHAMRKIGAMAVACMEQNGVLTREQELLDRRKVVV